VARGLCPCLPTCHVLSLFAHGFAHAPSSSPRWYGCVAYLLLSPHNRILTLAAEKQYDYSFWQKRAGGEARVFEYSLLCKSAWEDRIYPDLHVPADCALDTVVNHEANKRVLYFGTNPPHRSYNDDTLIERFSKSLNLPDTERVIIGCCVLVRFVAPRSVVCLLALLTLDDIRTSEKEDAQFLVPLVACLEDRYQEHAGTHCTLEHAVTLTVLE